MKLSNKIKWILSFDKFIWSLFKFCFFINISLLSCFAAALFGPPDKPKNFAAVPVGSLVKLTWNVSEGSPVYYDLKRVSGGSEVKLVTSYPAASFSDLTAVAGTAYTYSVRACSLGYCSGWNALSLITPISAVAVSQSLPVNRTAPARQFLVIPTVISNILVIPYDGLLYINWNVAPDATRYILVRNGFEISLANQTDYVDNRVFIGSTYSYGVKACNGDICSVVKNVASVTVSPASPVSVSVVMDGASAVVSWALSPKATSYKLKRSDGVEVVLAADAKTYTDKSVMPNTSYAYTVSACINDSCSAVASTTSVFVPSNVPPSLVSPANGGSFDERDNPCFTWSRGSATNTPTVSRIDISTAADFSGPVARYTYTSGLAASVCWNGMFGWTDSGAGKWIDLQLKPNMTYFWRVTMLIAGISLQSPVYSFTIKQTKVLDSEVAIRAAWGGVVSAMASNDKDKLIQNFDPTVANRYSQVFDALGTQLSAISQQLHDIEPLYVNENTAIYMVTKTSDVDGSNYVHTIKFIKDANGVWKVNEL